MPPSRSESRQEQAPTREERASAARNLKRAKAATAYFRGHAFVGVGGTAAEAFDAWQNLAKDGEKAFRGDGQDAVLVSVRPLEALVTMDYPATDYPATDYPATDYPATDYPATDYPSVDPSRVHFFAGFAVYRLHKQRGRARTTRGSATKRRATSKRRSAKR